VRGGDVEHAGGVTRARREDRDAVEARARRHHTTRAEQAARGLESRQPVECRRHAPRSGGVRAERKSDVTERHRQRRAGARAAADARGIGDRRTATVRAARADETGRELIHVRLADQQRTRVEQPLHDRRALVGDMREAGTRGGCRQAGDVDVVLDRERDPVQSQLRIGVVERLRRRQQGLICHARDPHRLLAACSEALQELAGGLGGPHARAVFG
jgi:hypothetical protein